MNRRLHLNKPPLPQVDLTKAEIIHLKRGSGKTVQQASMPLIMPAHAYSGTQVVHGPAPL
ncbi:hypothetical protein OYT88_03200 [Sporolactobacillus sp. CQH2019]|uniref:hypothetical protein n=1 Tax=Sporolactobacillus sp. CQH2019 TaxID=3023512 RepID=UPI002368802B|nr:hypothetical protein [Sporolactobacillus sp. CQH2019]MDD9147560.1 hypothetical protein [Sporolactobacillus sp. CQH2019]